MICSMEDVQVLVNRSFEQNFSFKHDNLFGQLLKYNLQI